MTRDRADLMASLRSAALVVAVVAGAALVADAVLAAPLFFSNDGFHHIFSAWGRAHLDDASTGYARYFVGHVPPSANGVADLFALLSGPFGWRMAHQLVVVTIAVVWFFGSVVLAGAIDRRRAFIGFAAAAGALGWNLYLGFFEFALATGLGFFAVALALRTDPVVASTSRKGALAALLLATSVVHFFAAAVTGVVVAVAWLAAAGDARERRTALVNAIVVGLPAAVPVVLLALAGSVSSEADGPAPWIVRLTAVGACTTGGPPWRSWPLIALVVVAVVVTAAAWRGRRRVELALAACAAACAAVPIVMPWSPLGWQNAAARPAAMAVALACALVPVERLPKRAAQALSAAAVVFFAAATLWARGLDVRLADESADVLRVLDHAPPNTGYRWPLVTTSLDAEKDAGLVRFDPQRGLGSLFALVQGGFVAHSHTVFPSAHTLLLKPEAEAQLPPPLQRSVFVTPLRRLDDDAARRAALDIVISHAVRPDGVIAIERPADHAQWRARGFAVDVEDGRVLLAHFAGCSLHVEAGAAQDVSTSFAPSTPALLQRIDHVEAGAVDLDALPCGPLEVRCAIGDAKAIVLTTSDRVSVACP